MKSDEEVEHLAEKYFPTADCWDQNRSQKDSDSKSWIVNNNWIVNN